MFGDIVSLGWIILNVIKLLGRAGIHQSSFFGHDHRVVEEFWSKFVVMHSERGQDVDMSGKRVNLEKRRRPTGGKSFFEWESEIAKKMNLNRSHRRILTNSSSIEKKTNNKK